MNRLNHPREFTVGSMSFNDALKRLNIEDFSERIYNSNSHGELMHLVDYIDMATHIKGDSAWFRSQFLKCVEFTEANWSRPESCFQHMPDLLTKIQ